MTGPFGGAEAQWHVSARGAQSLMPAAPAAHAAMIGCVDRGAHACGRVRPRPWVTIAAMPLFGRGGDRAEQDPGPDRVTVWAGADERWQEMPATVWDDARDRYRAMPLPERAADVMATIAPALAESFDKATWKQGIGPRGTEGDSLVALLIPSARRPDKLSPEQWRAKHELHVTLAEALNALVIARLLIHWDAGSSGGSVIKYAVSPDGLAAVERGDVAEVVARRLPD
jgi:hypothetical protein